MDPKTTLLPLCGTTSIAHRLGLPIRDNDVLTILALLALMSVSYLIYRRFFAAPSQQSTKSSSTSSAQTKSHLHVFPPSTYSRLGKTRKGASGQSEEQRLAELQASQIPAGVPIDQCDQALRTPTDMSIAEIRALGDFPDYAALSGVPDPPPEEGFVLQRAIARPFRPLRWKYIQNMSLMKLETDRWLELTSDYKATLAARQEILRKHGTRVLDWRPGTELAAKEAMELALSFYARRWPAHFSLENRASSSSPNWVFINRILGTETILRDHHPLRVLFDNVPEEFMLTVRNPSDGLYYLRGGVCVSAVGWTMAAKMDRPLAGVHGPVPDYARNMAFSMDRFFARMPADRPIQRGSFEIKTGRPLFMPPEEHQALSDEDAKRLTLDDVNFRVDWQTLRRLPLSGAIVFNFRCCFTPVREFRDEKHVPALLYKVLTESKENMLAYKATAPLEHVLLPALKGMAEEQVRTGLAERDWEVATLDDSPFFEGWREKWRRKMDRGESW